MARYEVSGRLKIGGKVREIGAPLSIDDDTEAERLIARGVIKPLANEDATKNTSPPPAARSGGAAFSASEAAPPAAKAKRGK